MSRAKPKAIWVVMANSQPVAAFQAEELADTLCMEMNAADRAKQAEQLKLGLRQGRTYYTWVKLTVGAAEGRLREGL